jgi:phosphatidylserine/phosphatidylglycerophosphate/cardiolipin synthase-like enzyme
VSTRQFLQTSTDARNSVRELLQSIFAAELILPSRCLWIVSPWLRDVPILDNSTGDFLTLCPDLPRTTVRLSRLLREMLTRGTQVVIATRPEPGNRQLLDGLGEARRSASLFFQERADLHAKGLVGDRYALIGSMNLTYNGIAHLTEMLVFERNRPRVEQLRLAFRSEYGGIA